jgi:hypothetical protein
MRIIQSFMQIRGNTPVFRHLVPVSAGYFFHATLTMELNFNMAL